MLESSRLTDPAERAMTDIACTGLMAVNTAINCFSSSITPPFSRTFGWVQICPAAMAVMSDAGTDLLPPSMGKPGYCFLFNRALTAM